MFYIQGGRAGIQPHIFLRPTTSRTSLSGWKLSGKTHPSPAKRSLATPRSPPPRKKREPVTKKPILSTQQQPPKIRVATAQHESIRSQPLPPLRWSKVKNFFSRWRRWIYGSLLLIGLGYGKYYTSVTYQWLHDREEVPVTGRFRYGGVEQFNEQWAVAIKQGREQEYDEKQKEMIRISMLPEDHPSTQRVRRVFEELIKCGNLAGLKWRLHVIDDRRVLNALTSPTGQVFITRPMMALATTDSELAAVLAHKIAHNIAEHGREGINNMILQAKVLVPLRPLFMIGGVFTAVAMLTSFVPGVALIVAVPGMILMSPLLVSHSLLMYTSRVAETEADYIGLLLMTQAGFEPGAAVDLQVKLGEVQEKSRRMGHVARNSNGEVIRNEWESTHPSSAARVRQIRENVPVVRKIVTVAAALNQAGTRSRADYETSNAVFSAAARWRTFLDGTPLEHDIATVRSA
ncbi:metalloendopeptidase [Recurvomyces mirabilis]|nr:metalloendopeptidase [Recurvomyces mirabilis]